MVAKSVVVDARTWRNTGERTLQRIHLKETPSMQDPKNTTQKSPEEQVETETPKPITQAIDEGKLNPRSAEVPTQVDLEHKEPVKKSA
jgi:hypothetical protein